MKLRTKNKVDPVEEFAINKVESAVNTGLLFLIILKLLKQETMHGNALRKTLTQFGFPYPHQTTLYTNLLIMRSMNLIEVAQTNGHVKKYRVTEKGRQVLARAEDHLKTLITRLNNM